MSGPGAINESEGIFMTASRCGIRLNFCGFENGENEGKVAQMLGEFRYLFPAWIGQLTVKPDVPDDNDTLLSIWFDMKYLRATIGIAPAFWVLTSHKQRQCLLHEIAHAWLAQMTSWVRNRLLSGQDDLTKERRVEFEERAESTVETLATAMGRLVPTFEGERITP